MKAKTLLKITAGLIGFFCLAHTAGAFLGKSHGAEEDALLSAMRSYQFDAMGFSRTHWDFYFGFSLFLSVNLAALTRIIWVISSSSDANLVRTFSWVLTFTTVGFAILSWVYFFPAPAIVNSLATITSLGAAIKSGNST